MTALEAPVMATGSAADPLRGLQWGLDASQFPSSWEVVTGEGVVVAVLDTGVDASHEDLAGSVLTGYDAILGVPGGTTDPNGHGTHVAGTIAAHLGNARGGAGAAPGVQILPVRVLAADGSGWGSDVAEGINWAVQHGADIINLSLGGPGSIKAELDALAQARSRGVVVVAAAGNQGESGSPPQYPAANPDVIAVAAVNTDGTRAKFSNYGLYIDLAAPGVGIVAPCPAQGTACGRDRTLPTGYGRMSGTSMATPHAAAAAALIVAAHPEVSADEVKALLESSAVDLGLPGWDAETGAGLVNPARALAAYAPRPGAPPASVNEPAPEGHGGYWTFSRDGRVTPYGSAARLGDASGLNLKVPIVAAARTPSGSGYWLAGADGSVFAFGDAPFLGSLDGVRLNAPVVGMAASTTGDGYWLLSADGGVFSFGDAAFYGSTGSMRLNRPVVDIAVSPAGRGYWLVATDGGVFSFGDAGFAGSTGGIRLNRPIISLAASASGGYWLVAEDGGIFAFGSQYFGSLPGSPEAAGIGGRRIRATPTGDGYYILGVNGQVFAFGSAPGWGWSPGTDLVDLLVAPQRPGPFSA